MVPWLAALVASIVSGFFVLFLFFLLLSGSEEKAASCVREAICKLALFFLFPFPWHVERQAGNSGMAQELSEPGLLARNVTQHKIFSRARYNIHSERSIYRSRVDCGNSDDESIHTR